MHYLYVITNKLNNKIYIGRSKKPEYRWKQHKNFAIKNNPKQYIHRAMSKYGIDNFTFEIILVSKTLDDANLAEDELINQYDSRNKTKGYNVAPGGKVKSINDISPEHQQALIEGHRKWRKLMKIINPTHPALGFQKGHQGKPNKGSFKKGDHNIANCQGHFISEETKQKISKSLKNKIIPGTFAGSKNHRSKLNEQQVLQIVELNKQGMKKQEIADKFGVKISTIYGILNGSSWGHITGRIND